MINRSSVIVRPKQPYIDWADGLDDSGILPTVDGEHTVYLIPEYLDDLDAMEILSKCYGIIFEMELYSWHTDKSAWPGNRSFAMFRDWFEIEFNSLVEDLCYFEVIDDDDMDEADHGGDYEKPPWN